MSKIKVIITEDEELFRRGMIQLIGSHPQIEVIGEASNGKMLLDLIHKGLIPDIVLMDLKMPEIDGIQATKIIKREFPDVRIIILTSHYSKLFVTNMVQFGAAAFHKKDSSPDSIIHAIMQVYDVGYYYDQPTMEIIQSSLASGRSRKKSSFDTMILSEREKEVLILLCQQKKTSEIAEELYIGVRTVEGHRNNLLLKTESKNLAGLVLYAVEHGIYKFDS